MPFTVGLHLRRYPYLCICVAIGLTGLLLYLIPGLQPEVIARYNDDAAYVAIGLVVTFAMARRARAAFGVEERRMWGWLALSFLFWSGAELMATLIPEANLPGRVGIPTDVLFFVSYTAWFLGINQAPHHPSGWTSRQPGWGLEQWGTLVVSLGLALDVGILPQMAGEQVQVARFYSSGLFVAFDAAILVRLVALASRTTAGMWRRWYRTMALMAGGMLAMDALATAIDHGFLPAVQGPLYDLAWYLPFWILAAACSLPISQPLTAGAMDLAERQSEDGASPLEGGLVFYASAFVVTHLLVGLTPLVPPAANTPRAGSALVVILILGLLAYRRQLRLEARVSQLSKELRQATFDLAQAQKVQAVARLAGGVAHDVNNLLTIILGHVEFLQRAFADHTQESHDIRAIREAALRTARLTTDLLNYGDTLPLKLEQRDLNRLVAGCQTELLAIAGPKIVLGIELRPSDLTVPVDAERFRLVVLQLARNAVEAMPDGGSLKVSTTRAWFGPASADRPSKVPPGEYVCLTVEDSGQGMDSDTQTRLFEPYFTTKSFGGGHGLGLPAVYGIVTRHHGYIQVRSEVGQGSRFDLLLPLAIESGTAATGN